MADAPACRPLESQHALLKAVDILLASGLINDARRLIQPYLGHATADDRPAVGLGPTEDQPENSQTAWREA